MPFSLLYLSFSIFHIPYIEDRWIYKEKKALLTHYCIMKFLRLTFFCIYLFELYEFVELELLFEKLFEEQLIEYIPHEGSRLGNN